MRAADLDLLFVPEPGGPAADHWQRRWSAKLSTARFLDEGVALAEAVRAAKRPTFLIAYSLGAVAVAEAAPSLEGLDVRGAFLVAPPTDGALASLQPGRALRRARLPFSSVFVASRTDPWAPFDQSHALAADWGSQFVDAGEAGRLDHDSGHGPWPDGLLRLAGILKTL